MSYGALPPKQGLYDPANEHDACGVAFVAQIDGTQSHALVHQGIQALERLEHRGACGCEPDERACFGGPNQGTACEGDDSICGEGGVCDACPVWGGVTTEEEMFGILGAYYVIQ